MALERPGRIRRRHDIDAPGVCADRYYVPAREIARDLLRLARLRRHPGLRFSLELGLGPARVEQHDISFTHRRSLLLLHRLHILDVEELARLHGLHTEVSRHVEHDAAGDDGGNLVDAEPGQPGEKGEVPGIVAVVVHAILRADVAEPVDLRSDAEPALEDIVVIGGVGEIGPPQLLIGLHDLQHEAARRKRWSRPVNGDAQAVDLTRRDELGRGQHGLRSDEVRAPYFVVRAPARRFAAVLGDRAGRKDECEEYRQARGPPGIFVIHVQSLSL